MNKTWIIFNRRKQDKNRRDGWNYFKEIGVSKQQAIHEMKRQVENDGVGREWAVFEMVSAFAAKVEVVEAVLVDPAEVLEDAPAIVVQGDQHLDVAGEFLPEPWPGHDDDLEA